VATLTVFVHVGREALVQSTRPALIAMGFVDGAAIFQIALRFAGVHSIPVNGTFEEPGTTCNIQTTLEHYALLFITDKSLHKCSVRTISSSWFTGIY
jgi:hypothetical protein